MVRRYRRTRRRRYSSFGRPIIGWYTDKKGRHRPITSSRGRRIRLPSFKISYQPVITNISESMVQNSFRVLAYSTPAIREIFLAYEIANTVYTHWNIIRRCYESYTKGDLAEAAKIMGKEILRETVPSMESTIIWNAIRNYVPGEWKKSVQPLLSKLVDELTEKEIDFVARHLD